MARPQSAGRSLTRSLALLCLGAVLSAGGLTAGLVAPASADIGQQIRDSQAQLDQVNAAAEQAAEHYNAGRIALTTARQRAAVARAAATAATAAMTAMRAQTGAFAVQAYRSGTSSGLDLAMLGDTAGPASFLDRASFLDSISRRNTDLLDGLARARVRQAQALAEAASTLAAADASLAGLTADKQQVAQRAAQAQTLLIGLQAKQAQLIAAARDAAARAAAQAQAAAFARQAALAATAAAAFNASNDAPTPTASPNVAYSGSVAQVALQVARNQLGKPYVWGAAGPDSFDCSGLTMYSYGKAGVSLPHYTGDQWNAGRHVAEGDLRPGDLIFFFQDLHHMAMYVGNGQFIQAPHSGDVVKISALSGYYQDNYAGAVRIAG